ncbi:hypothetical protein EON63_23435, partial [archaeon]
MEDVVPRRSVDYMQRSFDLDSMIEKEIRTLERDINKQDRESLTRMALGGYGVNRSAERKTRLDASLTRLG